MTDASQAVRAGGFWLVAASFCMIIVLLVHGPIDPDPTAQMAKIASHPLRWAVVHWIAAAGLSLFAIVGLILLTSHSHLTDGFWRLTAWAVISMGAFWTMTTAVAEATVITTAAVGGTTETFTSWWAFAEGKAIGFAVLALGIALVGSNEAREPTGATPAWSAWVATAAGVASFLGWALGMWLEIRPANQLWVVASVTMCLWTLWFGMALRRVPHGEMGTVLRAA